MMSPSAISRVDDMTEWIGRLDDSTKINGGRNGTTRTKRGKSSNNNDTNEGGRWNAEGCAAEWSGDLLEE